MIDLVQPFAQFFLNGGSLLVLRQGTFDHMLNAFLKIFRLEVLGDFDLYEMEGLSEAGVFWTAW